MSVFKEILALEGNILIILDLKEHKQAYQKELERRVGMGGQSIKRSVCFLLEKGFIKQIDYDGKIPNVECWLVLTDLGELAGACLLDCKKKLSTVRNRERD